MGFFIKTPCPARLEDMRTNRDGWHCGACDRTVRNLQNASPEQVREWLDDGPLCGRAVVDASGRLLVAGAFAALAALPAAADNARPPPTPESDVGKTECVGDAAADATATTIEAQPLTPSAQPERGLHTYTIVVGRVQGHSLNARQARRAQRRASRAARRQARRVSRDTDHQPGE